MKTSSPSPSIEAPCHDSVCSQMADKFDDVFQESIFLRPHNFCWSLVLQFPDDPRQCDEARVFNEFIQDFIQSQEREYGKIFYVALRERVKSPRNPRSRRSPRNHYNLIFLYDGKTTQNIQAHLTTAEDLWGRCLNQETNLGHPVDANGLVSCGKEYRFPKVLRLYPLPRPQQCEGVMLTLDSSEEFQSRLYYCRMHAIQLVKSHSDDAFEENEETWSYTQGIPSYPQPWIASAM